MRLKTAGEESVEIIKEDLNFLHYPLWVVEEKEGANKQRVKTITIEREHGRYTLTSSEELPNRFDRMVLDYLLHQVFKDPKNISREIITNRHTIAKDVFPGIAKLSAKHYQRVMTAVGRWISARVDFKGIFYQNGHRVSRRFVIVNSYLLDHDTGILNIKVDEDFVRQQRDSSYFKHLNINTFRKIKNSIAARFYEVLTPMFYGENKKWEIGLDSLAERLTISKRKDAATYYPSGVLPLLERGIKGYNEHAEIKVSFAYDKKTKMCTFTKKKEPVKKSEEREFAPAKKIATSFADPLMNAYRQELQKSYDRYMIEQGELIKKTLDERELQDFHAMLAQKYRLLGKEMEHSLFTAEQMLHYSIAKEHQDKILSFHEWFNLPHPE